MDLEKYLRFVADFREGKNPPGCKWSCFEAMVLDLGRHYAPARRPKGVKKQRDCECFRNAFRLVQDRPELRYAEGWAAGEIGVPVLHAWCVTVEGRVIDPTWRYPEKALGYFGVTFEIQDVAAAILASGYYGLIASDYLIGNPLLRTGNPVPTRLFARRGRH